VKKVAEWHGGQVIVAWFGGLPLMGLMDVVGRDLVRAGASDTLLALFRYIVLFGFPSVLFAMTWVWYGGRRRARHEPEG
jgi:hypothetical protein